MMKNNLMKILMVLVALLSSFGAQAIRKVHTIGDSTMAPYDPSQTVTRGWGMYLQDFLTENLLVANYAHGGCSTRSFYEDSRFWATTKTQLAEGDYVFIQFAHNDEKNDGMDGAELKAYYESIGDAQASSVDTRGTVPNGAYKDYLIKFVNESRIAGCTPVLVSPVCRKYFTGNKIRRNGRHDLGDSYSVLTSNGVLTNQSVSEGNTLMDYPAMMKHVADSMNVPFIDLTQASEELFEKYGDTKANELFFDGNGSTHFNETGATMIARLCAQKMKEQGILADDVNLTTELTATPSALSLGSGYKGQSLTKSFTLKGFELSPEQGSVSLTTTGNILVSTDQQNWSSSLTLSYEAGMILETLYAKYNITDENAEINGNIQIAQGEQTVNVAVTGEIVKLETGEAQDGVTATWTLGDGTTSSTNGELSVAGLTSTATMTIGSKLTVASPQSVNSLSFYRVQPTETVSADDDNAAINFTLTPKKGLVYVPTHIAFKTVRFGTDGGLLDIVASVGDNSVTIAQDIKPDRNNTGYSDLSYDIQNLVTTGDPVVIKFYVKSLGNTKQIGIRDIVVTGNFSGTVVEVPSYTLNVGNSDPDAGTISVSPEASVLDEGTEVTLSATENFGYHFIAWNDTEGNYLSESNPYTFKITNNVDVKAVWQKATVYNLDVKLTNGARSNLVKIEPEGNIVDGKHQYEIGTEVKLTAQNNKIMTFTGWEDNTTTTERVITMNSDTTITANFATDDYIVGWDLYDDSPKTERAADYKSDTENAGLLSLHNEEGATTSWLSRGSQNGQENGKYAARIWHPLTDKYFFEINFSTLGYNNVQVSNCLGTDYNSYSTIYEQVSLDGKEYETIGTFENIPARGWSDVKSFTLPEKYSNQQKVYVRWYPDFDSELVGVSSTNDGLSIAEIFVTADHAAGDDTVAPTLLSSNPADKTDGVSASGNIVLTFDEKVQAGQGNATLGDETLQPTITGKTVVYPYSGLSYATDYTFTLPAGAITDRNGNAFEGVSISFSTMERQQPTASVFDAIVAQDGTGDYTTVQAAIDAAPANAATPWLIFIKKGEYKGHITIPATKPHIHLIGQGKDYVTISDERTSGTGQYGIEDGATLDIESDNIYMEGIDLINSYGVTQNNGPQALALCSKGDRLIMNKMGLRSYQDTWFTGKDDTHRAYISNSLIEGAVDFFYGKGDAMIIDNTINIVRKSGGYIVAPNQGENCKWGYVFQNNIVTAPGIPSETDVWLGRPWHETPKTVYLNTRFEVTIPATGWYPTMGGIPALWAEFNSMDGQGNPLDLSQRRVDYYYYADAEKTQLIEGKSAKAVLTAEEAAQYTVKNVCSGDDGWNPELITEACTTPEVTSADGILSWQPVAYAICYVVTQGDEVVAITTNTTYDTTTALASSENTESYKVQAVNEYGSLSEYGIPATTTGITTIKQTDTKSATEYNITGQRVSPTYQGIVVTSGKKHIQK